MVIPPLLTQTESVSQSAQLGGFFCDSTSPDKPILINYKKVRNTFQCKSLEGRNVGTCPRFSRCVDTNTTELESIDCECFDDYEKKFDPNPKHRLNFTCEPSKHSTPNLMSGSDHFYSNIDIVYLLVAEIEFRTRKFDFRHTQQIMCR